MRHALYVIGEPGAGKSTLVRALTDGLLGMDGRKPIAHTTYLTAPIVTELGARRDNGFGGTDALAMSAIVPAEAWVLDTDVWEDDSMLLAEGDRLACDRFFTALIEGGWELRVAYIETSAELAEARRAQRAMALGTPAQNETWLRGRRTKVARLVERWSRSGHVDVLSGEPDPHYLAAQLAACSPVADTLYRRPA